MWRGGGVSNEFIMKSCVEFLICFPLIKILGNSTKFILYTPEKGPGRG